jgi:hypothetical protein
LGKRERETDDEEEEEEPIQAPEAVSGRGEEGGEMKKGRGQMMAHTHRWI